MNVSTSPIVTSKGLADRQDLLEHINRLLFGTGQWTGRQDRQVCIRVSVRGMQVATQLFDEDPNRAADVSNRGVYEAKHEFSIITVAPRKDGSRRAFGGARRQDCYNRSQSGRSAAW